MTAGEERPRRRSPSFLGLTPASEGASKAKRANGKRDTKHEVVLRRELWRLGIRYRKYAKDLPGKPDIVIRRARVVVFCDGDFWHGRNWDELRGKLELRHNAAYWVAKIERNRERDREQHAQLADAGWLVLRFWETDVLRRPSEAAATIAEAVRARLDQPSGKAASNNLPSVRSDAAGSGA